MELIRLSLRELGEPAVFLCYAPPEIVASLTYDSPECDVWSVVLVTVSHCQEVACHCEKNT